MGWGQRERKQRSGGVRSVPHTWSCFSCWGPALLEREAGRLSQGESGLAGRGLRAPSASPGSNYGSWGPRLLPLLWSVERESQPQVAFAEGSRG